MNTNNSFYNREELLQFGFQFLGENVLLSKKVSIYNAALMKLGNNCRIDDFCILSGRITIGQYVHVSAYTALYGGEAGIVFEDFSGISARGTVYAVSDDFSGEYMTNSMVPDRFRNVDARKVVIGRYCQLGAGCVVLPGVHVNEGSVTGAMSLVRQDLEEWGIYAGIPCRKIHNRNKNLLNYVRSVLDEECDE